DELDKFLRTPYRQRPEQHGIRDTEHGSIGANTQREGDDRHRRHARVLAQHAHTIAEILNDGFDEAHAPSVPAFFFDLLDAAKFAQRGVTSFFRAHPRREVQLDLL